MSAEPADFIEGAVQIVDHYGYWATFHDAQIVYLLIEPEEETITATFEYNDMTDDDAKSGSSKITLLWQKVVKYSLAADYKTLWMDRLYGIEFTQQEEWIETKIDATDGLGGTIRSHGVRVTHFETRLKDNHETSNTAPD